MLGAYITKGGCTRNLNIAFSPAPAEHGGFTSDHTTMVPLSLKPFQIVGLLL